MQISRYPASRIDSLTTDKVLETFRAHELDISSVYHELSANEVLACVSNSLMEHGFETATTGNTRAKQAITLEADDPTNAPVAKFDAYHRIYKVALNVLAGQGLVNNTYLKSLILGSLAPEVRHMVIAVRLTYKKSEDFRKVSEFLDVLMNSENTRLDLDSLTLIGY